MTYSFPQHAKKAGEPAPEPRIFLSRGEVADIFNVSPNTITRWADAGKLHFVRTLGGHRRYEKETIFELVNAQFTDQLDQTEEETRVNRMILDIPKLYGDHHVAPIQQALANRPGIQALFVSPAHRQIRIDFAPESVTEFQLRGWLVDAGYPPADTPPAPPVRPVKDLGWDITASRMTQTQGART